MGVFWVDEAFANDISLPLRFGVMEFSTRVSQELSLTPSFEKERINQHINSMKRSTG